MFKFIKNSILMFTALILLTENIQSQASVSASGSDASGPGGSVAYSTGLIAYTANAGLSGSITQGVQHAYEIYTVNTEEQEAEPTISAIVFPNPVSDALILRIEEYDNELLFVEITDIQGRPLQKIRISKAETLIDMAAQPVSTCFLHVMNAKNKKIKTFKIIKN